LIKKSAPETTARQQSVMKATLNLLTQNSFSAKPNDKCVMDDQSYFNSNSYYKSEDYPSTEDVIYKTKFPAKILLWLAVSEYRVSEPVFFESGFAVNKGTVHIQMSTSN
jgi:hypothetical protein